MNFCKFLAYKFEEIATRIINFTFFSYTILISTCIERVIVVSKVKLTWGEKPTFGDTISGDLFCGTVT